MTSRSSGRGSHSVFEACPTHASLASGRSYANAAALGERAAGESEFELRTKWSHSAYIDAESFEVGLIERLDDTLRTLRMSL